MGPLDNSYTPFKAFPEYPLLSILVYSESVSPNTHGLLHSPQPTVWCLFTHCIVDVVHVTRSVMSDSLWPRRL